jgi:hypothetical protein
MMMMVMRHRAIWRHGNSQHGFKFIFGKRRLSSEAEAKDISTNSFVSIFRFVVDFQKKLKMSKDQQLVPRERF